MEDTFKIAYRILFNLEFQLEGFSNDLNQHIKLAPDQDTVNLFNKYRMLSKVQKNSGVFLIDVEAEGVSKGKPVILPENGDVFRFQVKFSNSLFIELTHLAAYDWSESVMVLSNEANNKDGSDLLLSVPIQNYNAAHDYTPGYVVKSGPSFFRAIQSSSSGDPHGVSDPAFWKGIADGNVVSQADLQDRTTVSVATDLDTLIVIEIKQAASVSADYQLLDGSSICKELTYKIKFLKQN